MQLFAKRRAPFTDDILRAGAPARLAELRRAATKHNAQPYIALKNATWRDMRYSTLRDSVGIDSGLNDNDPVIYASDESALPVRSIKYADEILKLDHTGWFSDTDCSETIRGVVAALPHGRFLYGYAQSMNGEYVLFLDIETCERDAAHSADHVAERIAESEREYAERWQAAQAIESEIESLLSDLANKRAEHSILIYSRQRADDAPHFMEFGRLACKARESVSELCEQVREKRETLATEYQGVL